MERSVQELSFPELARELSQPLLRYFQRYVGEAATADDLLQETLIRIERGLPSFAARASIKTWAFSIATRVAADYLRQPERRLRIVEVNEAADLPDKSQRIEDRIIVEEMNACVRGVIDSLPEDYRAALILHDLEGLSAHDTARICGCSLATAKVRIHRARLRLRQALKRECELYRDSEDVLRCDRKT
jgi:RNA polymerase sigma-70 factor, ECF subfamily